MGGAIRIDQTVAKEVAVARHIFAEVTTIGVKLFSVFIFGKDTLVYPVPDPTALQVRIFVDGLPLSPQVTG